MSDYFHRSFLGVKILTLVAFLALMGLTWIFVESEKASKIQLNLETQASDFARRSVESIRSSVDTLHAVSSILVFFKETSFAQFKSFAQNNVESDDGLLILEWQPLVLEKERDAFINKARQQGLSAFELWEPDSEGNPIPAKSRPEHVPVFYMLSRDQRNNTMGLDLAWSEERMLSKWMARDQGKPVSSGFFNIVTGRNSEYAPVGFAITLPIYRDGVVPENAQERRSHLLGYIAGVYSLEDLLAPHLAKLSAEGFNIAIRDGSEAGTILERTTGEGSKYSRATSMNLYGNEWTILLTAAQHHTKSQYEPVWYLLPAFLVLFGLLVFLFLWLLQRKNNELTDAHQGLENALKKVRESESFLLELSRHDPLTGLFNRRAFLEHLNLDLDRTERHRVSTSLLMIDIDHFKQVNDEWGHPVGDEVLKYFAKICNTVSRKIDVTARMGGEEFAMLLPHTDEKQALFIAERLRQRIAEAEIRTGSSGNRLRVTASIGLAVTTIAISADELISRADKALYLAKNCGRNCVKKYE
ncbi:MAG: diguanylate cyclase [Candidatus Thiodiazotropha sp. (ex Epidulcina cf. delphinae)]|nr:diguanylate cyclase [Candidatus Thiodiazotropha sp. (ex Epidulcina cf. delphinae)]